MFEDMGIFLTSEEQYKQTPFIKALIYGDTGSGKTSFAARSPRPLILQLEKQGLASVHEVNRGAYVYPVSNRQQFVEVWEAILKGKSSTLENGQPALDVTLKGHTITIQTVVIDSITELTAMFHMEVEKTPGRKVSQPEWGVIKSFGNHILKSIDEIKCNVVALCRSQTEVESGKMFSTPITTPKSIAYDLGGYFNLVGKAGRHRGSAGIGYYISFAGEDRVSGKTFGSIPNIVWVTRQPGRTTLGSMMLHALEGQDVIVPANADDSAHWVTAGPPNKDEVVKAGDDFDSMDNSAAETAEEEEII